MVFGLVESSVRGPFTSATPRRLLQKGDTLPRSNRALGLILRSPKIVGGSVMEPAHSRLLSLENEESLLFMTGPPSAVRTTLLALSVFVVSFLADMLGDTTVFRSHGISVIWPTNALLVAVMLLMPRRTWPVLITAGMGAQVAHDLYFGFTLRASGLLALGSTIEVLIIGLGLAHTFDGVPRLNSLKALGKYCLFAAFLGPLGAAFIGASAISGSYVVNCRALFFGEVLPCLTLTPAILSWGSARRVWIHRSSRSTLEAAALLGTLAILGYMVLLTPSRTLSAVLLYCFVPLLLWSALRFGSLGVSTSTIVISFMSIWGAIHGQGPFTGREPFGDFLSLQLFLILAATPFMTLAAVVEDRERARLVEKELSGRLISAQEQERIRIARELHDDVCQRLALLSLKIEKAAKHRGGGQSSVAQQLEQIWQQCSTIAGDVQALSHELHPSILDILGLGTAVQSYCREVAEQKSVTVELSSNLPRSLPQDVSLSVFRVVQEALRNSVKYSGQKHFKVRLQENSGQLELEVSDQGIGFDVTHTRQSGGLGLVSMAERIYQVNGTLSIDSRPNAGTRIRARVPLAAPSASSN